MLLRIADPGGTRGPKSGDQLSLAGSAGHDHRVMVSGEEFEVPAHDQVVHDLRLLRERGLIRLRRLDLPALQRAAVIAGVSPADPPDPAGVEQLLRSAVDALGDEEPGLATRYLFGLVRGTIGRRPTDLREKAAEVYGRLSPETFRKEPERLLIDRVAEEILRICRAGSVPAEPEPNQSNPSNQPNSDSRPVIESRPGAVGADRSAGELGDPIDRLRQRLQEALQHVFAIEDGPGLVSADVYRSARYGPFAMPCGENTGVLWVRMGSIQELRDVDIVVASENTHLDPSRPFVSTLSGELRSGAAHRDASGAMSYDVVAVELANWVKAHGAPGWPIAAGVVAPTSSGRLTSSGIRRIYHAAVAHPRPGTHSYDVSMNGVIRAVHHCFQLARQERDDYDPPLASLSMPLFGAGRGNVDPVVSFSRIWPVIRAELTADPRWAVHLTTLRPAETAVVLRGLYHSLDDAV